MVDSRVDNYDHENPPERVNLIQLLTKHLPQYNIEAPVMHHSSYDEEDGHGGELSLQLSSSKLAALPLHQTHRPELTTGKPMT